MRTQTKCWLKNAATSGLAKDCWCIAAANSLSNEPIARNNGFFSRLARANASSPHGSQWTGASACARRNAEGVSVNPAGVATDAVASSAKTAASAARPKRILGKPERKKQVVFRRAPGLERGLRIKKVCLAARVGATQFWPGEETRAYLGDAPLVAAESPSSFRGSKEQQRALGAGDNERGPRRTRKGDGRRGSGFTDDAEPELRRQDRTEAAVPVAFQQEADAAVKTAGGWFRAEVVADAKEVELTVAVEVARDDRVDRGDLGEPGQRLELEGAIGLLPEHAAREFVRRETPHGSKPVGGKDLTDGRLRVGVVGREFPRQPREAIGEFAAAAQGIEPAVLILGLEHLLAAAAVEIAGVKDLSLIHISEPTRPY